MPIPHDSKCNQKGGPMDQLEVEPSNKPKYMKAALENMGSGAVLIGAGFAAKRFAKPLSRESSMNKGENSTNLPNETFNQEKSTIHEKFTET